MEGLSTLLWFRSLQGLVVPPWSVFWCDPGPPESPLRRTLLFGAVLGEGGGRRDIIIMGENIVGNRNAVVKTEVTLRDPADMGP